MSTIRVQHFSDVLCVWAYVSQVRIDELRNTFPDSIEIEYRFVQIFGAVRQKLARQWSERGGARGYGEHVKGVVAQFGHVPIHPEIWERTTPESSMPAHLMLCAIRGLAAKGDVATDAFERTAWAIREAFFRDAVDVSRQTELLTIAERQALPVAQIAASLADGTAHAALASDLDLCRDHDVRASPTMIFNEGRQRLTGNVGYRIIEANVRELLERPAGQHSWC